MLIHLQCTDFLDELASDSPAPGGGSVSALAGSLGAALTCMVANLTLGKEKYKELEEEMQHARKEAAGLKGRLRDLVDQDTAAFNHVMAAFRLPKDTGEEKAARSKAIQEAMKQAAQVPMDAAGACYEVLLLAEKVVKKGNPNALSDGGVGALMAAAGVQGALFNVEINLSSIKDEGLVKEMRNRSLDLEKKTIDLRDEIIQTVKSKL